jgi:signal transduction histidine kinase
MHWFAQQRLRLRLQLQSVFEGGPAGRKRAALLFLLWVAPVSTVVATVLSDTDKAVLALRLVVLAVLISWLMVRKALHTVEWALLLALLAAVNVTTQLSAGAPHSGVLALNGLGVFAMVCIAFDTSLVVIAAALFMAGYTIVQFRFYPWDDAAAATVMYLVVLGVVAVVVHGTALYLRDSLRRVGELNREMGRTAERERSRIAGELHDDTIQVLTAAGLRLDALAHALERGGGEGDARSAAEIGDIVREAVERTRRLSFDLYPPQLDQGGLGPALTALATQLEAQTTIDVTVSANHARLPPDVERLAYRTIKELVTNAGKHSGATRVTVAVSCDDARVTGLVEDDGRGFDAAAIDDARRGFHIGLTTAADRVRLAGGRLDVSSAPDRGTSATFTLPIAGNGYG